MTPQRKDEIELKIAVVRALRLRLVEARKVDEAIFREDAQ